MYLLEVLFGLVPLKTVQSIFLFSVLQKTIRKRVFLLFLYGICNVFPVFHALISCTVFIEDGSDYDEGIG